MGLKLRIPRPNTLTVLELGGLALVVCGVWWLSNVGYALLAAGGGLWSMRVAADRVSTRTQRWSRPRK